MRTVYHGLIEVVEVGQVLNALIEFLFALRKLAGHSRLFVSKTSALPFRNYVELNQSGFVDFI